MAAGGEYHIAIFLSRNWASTFVRLRSLSEDKEGGGAVKRCPRCTRLVFPEVVVGDKKRCDCTRE